MSLLTLQTNLKSLKFGVPPASDRPNGGNSGQPYITSKIPGTHEELPGNVLDNEDFLLRGGLNAPLDAATDIVRLGKMFKDFKSPSGMLFVAKQNLLSRIATRTQASGKGLNEGIYTPLSTLAQAGIGFTGGHVAKQGLDPFKGPTKYLSLARNGITDDIGSPNSLGGRVAMNITDEADNRLIQLTKLKIGTLSSYLGKPLEKLNQRTQISPDPNLILSYKGGPNSDIGIGKTNIRIATGNKGAPLTTIYRNNLTTNFKTWSTENIISLGTGDDGDLFRNYEEPYSKNTPDSDYHSTIYDFRKPLIEKEKSSTIMSLAPSYNPAKDKTIDGPVRSRINYVSPGQRGNVIDYDAGKLKSDGKGGWEKMGPVDRINALPIYKSSDGGLAKEGLAKDQNDLIKFRIGAIRTENSKELDFMNFRAYIDNFSDTYSSTWNSQKYMGRGEQFYKYDGFNRDINLGFTVAAQSKEEIMVMYRKLNFLVSNLTPEYTKEGYMAGPLVQLTIGGWCWELPGFIKNITLDIPQESPWEIGIPNLDRGSKSVGGITYRNPTVKEMPMICKVTGFTFTPIHRFRPQKQTLNKDTGGMSPTDAVSLIDTNTYGDERYIALANGRGRSLNNYDTKD